MFWRRSRADFVKGKGDGNRTAMRRLVKSGEIPGILAYRGKIPLGWCAVAPRECYPALGRSRILKPLDEKPVWSISCLFVKKECRGQGISVALLKAVITHVRRQGGAILEGYPVEPRKGRMPDAFAWTGLASAFRQAGFRECARRSPTRPVMRAFLAGNADRKTPS